MSTSLSLAPGLRRWRCWGRRGTRGGAIPDESSDIEVPEREILRRNAHGQCYYQRGSLRSQGTHSVDDAQRIRHLQRPLNHNGKPSGRGALFFVRDLIQSDVGLEETGNSLQNFANVHAIQVELENLLNHGIEPEDITVLTLYRGQTKLIVQKVCSIFPNDGREI